MSWIDLFLVSGAVVGLVWVLRDMRRERRRRRRYRDVRDELDRIKRDEMTRQMWGEMAERYRARRQERIEGGAPPEPKVPADNLWHFPSEKDKR